MIYFEVINFVAALACVAVLIFTISNPNKTGSGKIMVSGIAFMGLAYYTSIFLGYATDSYRFEYIENIIGAILPIWWAFLFYILQNKVYVRVLSDSEKRYRELVHNIPGAVFRCQMSKDWKMQFISDYIKELSGFPASDFIDNSVRKFVEIIHPDDRQMVWEKIDKKIAKKFPYNLEYRIVDKNKEIHWILEKGQPVENENGQIDQIHGAMFDITEQKRAEQEREKITAMLVSKNDELESIFQVASHDLKSPITNISGFSHELEKDIDKLKAINDENCNNAKATAIMSDIFESVRFIKLSSEKLGLMIDGLLKVSRISRKPISYETINMNTLIENIRHTTSYQTMKNNIEFTVDQLPQCSGDKLMIGQIFTNLVDNAIKYSSPDRPGKIQISGKVEHDKSVYCVSDNGIGIEEYNLDDIFDLFYRTNPNDEVKGEGLGLTIVKRMLKLQNGDIRVESEPGIGSKFYVTLPNW